MSLHLLVTPFITFHWKKLSPWCACVFIRPKCKVVFISLGMPCFFEVYLICLASPLMHFAYLEALYASPIPSVISKMPLKFMLWSPLTLRFFLLKDQLFVYALVKSFSWCCLCCFPLFICPFMRMVLPLIINMGKPTHTHIWVHACMHLQWHPQGNYRDT